MKGKHADAVLLAKHPLRWRSLPISIKTGIIQNLRTVADTRSRIEGDALVAPMPHVQVLDTALVAQIGGGCVHGRTTPIRTKGGWHFVAQLAAPTILYSTREELRAILVHEFAHCFYFIREMVLASDNGRRMIDRTPAGGSFRTEDEDRATLEKPSDWFGSADADGFAYWDSPLLRNTRAPDGTRLLRNHTPAEV